MILQEHSELSWTSESSIETKPVIQQSLNFISPADQ